MRRSRCSISKSRDAMDLPRRKYAPSPGRRRTRTRFFCCLQNSYEAEQFVAFGGFPLVLAEQDARGQPGHADAVAPVSQREQVPRKIAVRADDGETVRGAVVQEVPAPGRLDSGDGGIQSRQLVHQLV